MVIYFLYKFHNLILNTVLTKLRFLLNFELYHTNFWHSDSDLHLISLDNTSYGTHSSLLSWWLELSFTVHLRNLEFTIKFTITITITCILSQKYAQASIYTLYMVIYAVIYTCLHNMYINKWHAKLHTREWHTKLHTRVYANLHTKSPPSVHKYSVSLTLSGLRATVSCSSYGIYLDNPSNSR